MAKQTFGGDDNSGNTQPPPQEPRKKLDLGKFASKPDANIRDVFWAIMAAYATKKPMKDDVRLFSNSRVALMKIALGILENPESAYYGLSLNFTCLYTLMMFLDGDWDEEFRKFLNRSHMDEIGQRNISGALKKLLANVSYRENLTKYFKSMLLLHEHTESALAYIAECRDRAVIELLKKEIMIIARSDVDMPQRYAMKCLAVLKDQPDVIMLFSQLLAHWDEKTREYAAEILKDTVNDGVLSIAKSQLNVESDPRIKKLLDRIVQKNVKNKEQQSIPIQLNTLDRSIQNQQDKS